MTSNQPPERHNEGRIPDDQRAPNVQPRETHQTSEVPLGSGDRPEAPGSGGHSARTTHRTPAIRERNESDKRRDH
jgi:hypothetical protein